MSEEATSIRPIDPLAHRALEALVRAESSLTRRLAADLDRIVQLRPRARIAFKAVTPARAVEIARQAARARSMWLDRLARCP